MRCHGAEKVRRESYRLETWKELVVDRDALEAAHDEKDTSFQPRARARKRESGITREISNINREPQRTAGG